MENELWRASAKQIADGIREKTFTCREVVDSCLDRIADVNHALRALSHIRPEDARAQADRADAALAAGEALGPLHGVPVVIKGNVDVADWPTVNGCNELVNNIAATHSPCVENWLSSGAIVIGRTNTPEFCCRWETSNEVFGQTANPWNAEVTPGGSSGGTASAIAAGLAPLGHGTDLGGSLRHPAQCCGIASLKPTLGRVPDWVPSLEEPSIGFQLMNTDGPMARRVEDLELGLRSMACAAGGDPWWVPAEFTGQQSLSKPIAVVFNPNRSGASEHVRKGVEKAVEILSKTGFGVEEALPPRLDDAVKIWKEVCVYELLNGLRPAVEGFCGDRLKRALAHYSKVDAQLSPEAYQMALTERTAVLREWMSFFDRYGAIVAPVSTLPPQSIDFDINSVESTLTLMESMNMVVPINALGLPAVVVPVGVEDGLPQAVQIIGAPFEEMRCLAIASRIEAAVDQITPVEPS